jgi:hypothetical protein
VTPPPLARLVRVPLTVSVVWAILVVSVPMAMAHYAPWVVRPGIRCVRTAVLVRLDQPFPAGMCQGLADLYHVRFPDLFVDSMFRSLALLAGAAVLALLLGTLLGVATALLRRRAWASGGIVAITTLLSAIPAFFVAYFLQIFVIIVGASPEGAKFLPVFGFGYDEHLVLPRPRTLRDYARLRSSPSTYSHTCDPCSSKRSAVACESRSRACQSSSICLSGAASVSWPSSLSVSMTPRA